MFSLGYLGINGIPAFAGESRAIGRGDGRIHIISSLSAPSVKNGEKLKKISSEARADMEQLLNQKVFLQVWVKVRSGFADEAKFLKSFE